MQFVTVPLEKIRKHLRGKVGEVLNRWPENNLR